MADIPDSTMNFSLHDEVTPDNSAKVDSSGNLYVVTSAPVIPVGKTYISALQQGDVTGAADFYTIIPIGYTITIQRFKAGSERDPVAGNKVELYYAPNGNTTGIVIIEILYVNGDSGFFDLNYVSAIGNGTRAILLRRQRLGGGAIEIFGKWEGYY